MVISSLFFTNLWIFIYTNLLQFLNSTFPAETPSEFIRTEGLPEPFEIPLYLVLSLIFVLVVFFFQRLPKNQPASQFRLPLLKPLTLIFLILLFISNIGVFPMARSVYPYLKPETASTYTQFLITYLLIVLIFIFILLKLKNFLFISII